MTIFKTLCAGAVGVLFGVMVVGQANASVATLLDESSVEYFGYYTKPEPASPADEASYIEILRKLAPDGFTTLAGRYYDRSSNTLCYSSCPSPTATGALKDDSGDFDNITLDGSWAYLIGKYDGPNAGSLVWYVTGLSGGFMIPDKWGPADKQYGLSHWTLFKGGDTPPPPPPPPEGSVPEPGSLALVGLALLGAVAARRRQRQQ